MRLTLLLLFCLVILAGNGCGQSAPSKDMGTVVNEIPKVQGADKPYYMPKLGEPNPEEKSGKAGQ